MICKLKFIRRFNSRVEFVFLFTVFLTLLIKQVNCSPRYGLSGASNIQINEISVDTTIKPESIVDNVDYTEVDFRLTRIPCRSNGCIKGPSGCICSGARLGGRKRRYSFIKDGIGFT